MKKIVHYIGLDVHKETGDGIVKNRYTRCARPAEPDSEGDVIAREPRVPLADSLYPGLHIFHPIRGIKWPAASFSEET